MEILLDNWYIILTLIAVLMFTFGIIMTFLGHPTSKQVEKIKTWLLQAVILAEKEMGGKTGEAKLALVYDGFIEKFPWISKVMSFDRFKRLVDTALDEMKTLMSEKQEYKEYIEEDEDK